MRRVFVVLVSLLLMTQTAWARQNLIPGSRYMSARAAALGDALMPIGDDVASGLFNNPALLGKLRKTEIEPFNLAIYGNTGFTSVIDMNFYKVINLSDYQSNLQRNPGNYVGSGTTFVPSIGFPGFSFGILVQTELAGRANADTTTSYRSLYQLIPVIGTGFRLGVLRFGYSLQWVNQASGQQTVATSSTMAYNEGLAQGSGFSHTAGLALTIPMKMLPSLNFVVRNIMDTTYNSYTFFPVVSNSTGAPAMEPMTVDASFSLQPRLGKGTTLNLVVVDRDITNRTGVAFIGHFALGAEISFRDRVFLRGGWNGGYPSAGLGLRRQGAEISLTYYTEEVGQSYMSQGDTRFMLQYQLGSF